MQKQNRVTTASNQLDMVLAKIKQRAAILHDDELSRLADSAVALKLNLENEIRMEQGRNGYAPEGGSSQHRSPSEK